MKREMMLPGLNDKTVGTHTYSSCACLQLESNECLEHIFQAGLFVLGTGIGDDHPYCKTCALIKRSRIQEVVE